MPNTYTEKAFMALLPLPSSFLTIAAIATSSVRFISFVLAAFCFQSNFCFRFVLVREKEREKEREREREKET